MADYRPSCGYIEMIVGPMFSGKSDDLIKNVNTFLIAKKKVMVFKPEIDKRDSEAEVVSRNGKRIQAIPVKTSKEILDMVNAEEEKPFVVAVDEIQFFDEGLVEVADSLADDGIRVILSGLDMDFRAEPFLVVSKLMAKAEIVTKLKAVCTVCGQPATRSQRLVGGKPASYSDEVIQIGDSESYEARCRLHHYVDK